MKPALIGLQLFNAIFIGIIAGIGMLYFQDLMPGRPGAATTMFTNSISTGVILAGVLQGRWWRTWAITRCTGWRRRWRRFPGGCAPACGRFNDYFG
ncbi:Sugar efflux transporter A [Serratia rubidaea]|uniref:Sugar efflux transporter A n=1 Tax=Serratia rubidaea TaxID=61652 RepID=A0A447QP73_SERRU|nr:Sugar efflux transporter A [Serratia rubidaea]